MTTAFRCVTLDVTVSGTEEGEEMAERAAVTRPPWEREEFPDIMLPIQAARLMGVSRMTIFRWIKWGWIQPVIVNGKRMLAKNQLEEVRRARSRG